MSITEIIKPIKLLRGSHEDTAKTGQGCFMNVIAYLNGEAQITDQSPCVCVTVRKIAIRLNDLLQDDQRQRMIPFIERAMGSADCSKEEFKRRLDLLVVFANKQAALAKRAATAYATNAANAAYATNAADYADYAAYAAKADYAADYAANYADYADAAINAATSAADYAAAYIKHIRSEIIEAYFEFLDAALPLAQQFDQSVIKRAESLCALA